MPRFDFQARDRGGGMQAGVLEEPSLQAAVNTLRARQWLVLNIDQAKAASHLVKAGKAVHNMAFSDQLIGRGYQNLNSALEIVGADERRVR